MKQLKELFDISYGNKFDRNKMTESRSSSVAFVGRSGSNQGVSAIVDQVEGVDPYPSGLLTVALGGSILSTFVQSRKFYTGQNVAVLQPLTPMTLKERMYYARVIEHNRFRYTAFGREANRSLATLKVPSTAPDWVNLVEVPDTSHAVAPAGEALPLTNISTWGRFRVDDLFKVSKGSYVPGLQKATGATRRISSTATNNGQAGCTSLAPEWPGGTITVARNGSVGEAFYQPNSYFATDDVHVFEPIPGLGPTSPEASLFVATVIRLEKPRYNYGRKWGLEKMRETVLMLPQNADGRPDWEYMKHFIRGLSMSSALVDSTSLAPGLLAAA